MNRSNLLASATKLGKRVAAGSALAMVAGAAMAQDALADAAVGSMDKTTLMTIGAAVLVLAGEIANIKAARRAAA